MGLKRVGMLLFGLGILAAFVLVILGDPLPAEAFADCAGASAPTFVGVGSDGFLFSNGCSTVAYAHPALWGVLLAAVGVLIGSVGVVREFAGTTESA